MNLNESTIKIDVNSLKAHLSQRGINYSINQIKDDLKSLNAVVRGERDANGDLYMIIGGDIDMDGLDSVFDECMVNVNDFIVDDIDNIENYGVDFDDIEDDLLECDAAPLDETIDYPKYDDIKLDEKKKNCCPKKKINESKSTPISSLGKKNFSKNKKVNESGTPISSLGKKFYHKNEQKENQHLIPLKEALSGKPLKYQKNPNVDEIIDSLTGKRNSRSINEAAMNKARQEAKKPINENYEYLSKKLGEELASRIWKALGENKTSLYEKVKINGKSVAELTLEELQSIFDKVVKKIDELENTTKSEGLNETDATNAEKKLALNTRLKTILTEEIEFRSALKEADDAESFLDQFNLDPNAENQNDDNNSNDNENNSDDNANAEDNNSDDNDNPDNDEVEEIGSIVLTMASEQAANDLKDELIAEGVPEDVIEIEPVEDETEEDNSEENNEESSDENNTEENNSDNNNEEKPNESANSKVKTGKLNEDDENRDENADDNASDENQDDNASNDNANAEDEEDKQFKVILTNTDYADKLQTVMSDIYGIEKEEFEEMIGGTIVDDESDDDKNSNDENSSDENQENADGNDSNDSNDKNSDESSDDEIDPDTVFKGL